MSYISLIITFVNDPGDATLSNKTTKMNTDQVVTVREKGFFKKLFSTICYHLYVESKI